MNLLKHADKYGKFLYSNELNELLNKPSLTRKELKRKSQLYRMFDEYDCSKDNQHKYSMI